MVHAAASPGHVAMHSLDLIGIVLLYVPYLGSHRSHAEAGVKAVVFSKAWIARRLYVTSSP